MTPELKIILKKLAGLFLLACFLYLVTGLVVEWIHAVLFQSEDYLSFNSPLSHLTKFFVLGLLFSIVLIRSLTLTPFGKRFLTVTLLVSIIGIPMTILWFNAIDEDRVVAYRVIAKTTYDWEEIESISTEITRESRVAKSRKTSRSRPLRVFKKYNIHLHDGKKVNVWGGLDSVYKLHEKVLEKDIPVTYNKRELKYFRQSYTSYFKDDLVKAEYVFYGVDPRENKTER